MFSLNVNGNNYEVEVDSDTPLLWVIRDHIGLTGTKFGCGIAYCGACSIKVGGNLIRSCTYPVSAVADQPIETIESLGNNFVQQAWQELDVPQCGYCQSGMIMAATHLLETNRTPSNDDIDKAITNICRCGTYSRIRAAIHTAVKNHKLQLSSDKVEGKSEQQEGKQRASELFYDASIATEKQS